ncbi:L-iditol 2-dehydrogenase/L-idonate 5-dehydrogenase [Larkinella arboricola]|uniref:L-iditol 2-dehydrogenase/L-idonate 5-dehydrogenase n=1 Tax=Larkinella arboricola TaxID=643671 RepID=A0A327WMQ5_LARAB|nr:alcohol dehydrogenase catalytic domain-containing protein [Larkinella arboricola]RAJ93229.1 L-iditol 2-dehydrogenase/L-idonate 5-dehydrogenase [Larkinella arboricola]
MKYPLLMQGLQMQGIGNLVNVELPVPVPKPDEVLIRTQAATICTSDLHDLATNPFKIPLPRVLGHEAAGIVVACGSEVTQFFPGDRVAAHPVVPCGTCAECRRGLDHLCANMGHLGYDRDGAFATYFVQRADRVRGLPPNVSFPVGALLEPVSVCLQAVARAGDVRNRVVLVVGDGPFGNMIARLTLQAGASRVLVVGREPFRLKQIPGVEIVDVPATRSVDVAILAVSSAEAATVCLSALRPRGRLVVFSALVQPVPLDLFSLHLSELEIVGACNDESRLDEALTKLSDPDLALHEIITHTVRFEEWEKAFDLAKNHHDRALKVALTFDETLEK